MTLTRISSADLASAAPVLDTMPAPAAHPYAHLRYRRDIDGLRALAVGAVVAFHAAPSALTGGFVGVDIFFVISGFLITSILAAEIAEGEFSIARFYARRVKRIFPALGLVLFATLAAGWLFLLADEYAQLGRHVAGGAGFVSNLVLWSEADYFDNASVTKPLLHLWSLGVEEQFYIVWPLLLWGAFAAGVRSFWVVGSVIALSLAANLAIVPSHATAAFYSPATRFWELAAGGALALSPQVLARVQGAKLLREAASWVGLALCLAAIVAFSDKDPFPGWRAMLPVAGAVLLIAAGPEASVNRVLLSSRVFVWLGLISYPLYLWHWPLLSFGHIAAAGEPPLDVRLGLCGAAVVLAWLTYRYVEAPIRAGAVGRFTIGAPLGAVALLGMLGLTVMVQDGIGSRRVVSMTDLAGDAHASNEASPALERYLGLLQKTPDYLKLVEDQRSAAIRWPECHFSKYHQNFKDFAPGMGRCLALDAKKPNVLVIGDSHGGDFYAVLARSHPNLHVLQATGASCAPISSRYPDKADPCGQLIERAMAFADTHKLAAVVLAGLWWTDADMLQRDIARLKTHGQRVIVVGQPLQFSTDVSRIIERRTSNFGFDRYMTRFLEPKQDDFNAKIKAVAEKAGAMFLDRKAYQCAPACSVLRDDGELLIRDYGHLTAVGASHLGDKIYQDRAIERLMAGENLSLAR